MLKRLLPRTLRGRLLLVLIGAQLLIGALFGATQTGTTALATFVGEPGLAGDALGDEQADGVGAAVDGAHAHRTGGS